MTYFLENWASAAMTSLGFFWMAFWAFSFGYLISSMIQVFVTEKRMQKTMGDDGPKSILLGAFFGFISSSCSFAALATSKSLFQKGAGFTASLAFLLSSTNLVIELGIVISIFLGWQFVVGEYIGGLFLILISWGLIRIIQPIQLIKSARNNMNTAKDSSVEKTSFFQAIRSKENWVKVGKQYGMEWKMVWKDVTIGFTIAGIVASFVPDAFFETLFINSGSQEAQSFPIILEHVLIGPIAAFLTFIGSMGNIPLAALLFGKGVSFAGVMAFIFSDLVVFPVLRINAKYYGWKMSFFILFLLFASLTITSLVLHYSLEFFDLLPSGASVNIVEQDHFKVDYSFVLNIVFMAISGLLIYLGFFSKTKSTHHKEMAPKSKNFERILTFLALLGGLWLITGLVLQLFILN